MSKVDPDLEEKFAELSEKFYNGFLVNTARGYRGDTVLSVMTFWFIAVAKDLNLSREDIIKFVDAALSDVEEATWICGIDTPVDQS